MDATVTPLEIYSLLIHNYASEVPEQHFYRHDLKESEYGQIMLEFSREEQRDLVMAMIGWLVALFIAPSAHDALVIPLTLLSVIFCGCLCGGALPIAFKRLGLDPAMMSNPFVAGIVDILGIVIYINIARGVLG